ncbi:MAG TPA: hypothetical protein P5572_17620 [Phycisphaerae bacterium]|nr:hypothetical protein [Phycisphaerales bacterium]HRX86847.1 hypothetical protein [Phycisphaerae bacterium]
MDPCLKIRRRRGTTTLLAGLLLTAVPAWAQAQGNAADQSVEREIKLPSAKASALFNLLAPQRVRVLVDKTSDGVSVRGTEAEVDAIAAFGKLLTRDAGTNYATDEAALEKLKKTWDSEETYQVPQDSLAALYATLAFDDVPVYVDVAEGGVSVQATKDDQAVVRRMVKIVKGEALQAKQKAAAKPAEKVEKPKAKRRTPRGAQEMRRRTPGANDNRIARLEKRIDELEKRLAALEGRSEHSGDHAERPERPERPHRGSAQMVDRRYRLPEPHLANLFQLFAPSNITSVIVGVDGNELRVRATEKDQRTIERLIELITRGNPRTTDARDADGDSDSDGA